MTLQKSAITTTTHHEWLPMPSGLSITSHDSFTQDLLYQFDKRYSREYTSLSIENSIHQQSPKLSSESAASHILVSSSSAHSHSTETTATGEKAANHVFIEHEQVIQGNNNSRSRSAGNLLRKSSMYLRNKFNEGFHYHHEQHQHIEDQPGASVSHSWALKKKQTRLQAQDVFENTCTSHQQQLPPPSQPLSKIAMNTTIEIPPHPNPKPSGNGNPILQPPIITQYPPKPLKYSPVEPLPQDQDDTTSLHHHKSRILHRPSLPLLKLAAQHQRQPQRRRSDSDLLNAGIAVAEKSSSSHSMLHSISKKWGKLFSACIKRGAKKKEL